MGLQSPQSAFLHHVVRDCIPLSIEVSRDNNPALLCDGHPSPLPQRRNVPLSLRACGLHVLQRGILRREIALSSRNHPRVQRSRRFVKEQCPHRLTCSPLAPTKLALASRGYLLNRFSKRNGARMRDELQIATRRYFSGPRDMIGASRNKFRRSHAISSAPLCAIMFAKSFPSGSRRQLTHA
jgi:hypothetical protein